MRLGGASPSLEIKASNTAAGDRETAALGSEPKMRQAQHRPKLLTTYVALCLFGRGARLAAEPWARTQRRVRLAPRARDGEISTYRLRLIGRVQVAWHGLAFAAALRPDIYVSMRTWLWRSPDGLAACVAFEEKRWCGGRRCWPTSCCAASDPYTEQSQPVPCAGLLFSSFVCLAAVAPTNAHRAP